MKNARNELKKMVREIISETLAPKKLLTENYNYEKHDMELEIPVGDKLFLVKGSFTCEVETSQGGFDYDRPFGGGSAHQSESESEVINQLFTVEELYPIIPGAEGQQPTVGAVIKEPAIITAIQKHINKTHGFESEEEDAIQAAHDAGQ